MLVGVRTSSAKTRLQLIMKTQMKPTIWFLTLLVLVCAPHPASAYYDPGVQRWINRDPVAEVGGLNLYAFLRNAPVTSADALGLRWWSWFPVLNLLNCFFAEPGEKVSDYYSIPMPNCEKCKLDVELAESECRRAAAVLQTHYTSGVFGPMVVSGVGDFVLAGISLAYPPVWIPFGAGVVGTGCEVKAMMNIDKAANQYTQKYCKCPQSMKKASP